jgi:hypothetical protein
MATIDFSIFFDSLKTGIKKIAADQFGDFLQSAINDGEQIISDLKEQLEIWTKQLAAGELTRDEFEYCVLSGVDLLKMVALKNAGLAQVKVDSFKSAVSSLIIQTAGSLIPL